MKGLNMKSIISLLVLGLSANLASANQFDASQVYFGGGLSLNSLSGYDDAIGYQAFGGYPLDVDLGGGKLSVEVGYMNSGDFETTFDFFGTPVTVETDASGIWGTAVGEWEINDGLNLLGRIGMDFGDDDGLMLGGGVSYNMSNNLDLRGEYVIRDNIDSLQINVVYYP